MKLIGLVKCWGSFFLWILDFQSQWNTCFVHIPRWLAGLESQMKVGCIPVAPFSSSEDVIPFQNPKALRFLVFP